MWIVFGTKSQLTRVPGGLKVQHQCPQCGEVATFYEKHMTKTARLYFIDVFDYEKHRVMACGCCGATYVTDELGARRSQAGEDNLLGDHLGRAVDSVGGHLSRAADMVEQGISGLLSRDRNRAPAPPPREQVRARREDEDDIVAGIGRVDDDMEARFRALEEADEEARRAGK